VRGPTHLFFFDCKVCFPGSPLRNLPNTRTLPVKLALSGFLILRLFPFFLLILSLQKERVRIFSVLFLLSLLLWGALRRLCDFCPQFTRESPLPSLIGSPFPSCWRIDLFHFPPDRVSFPMRMFLQSSGMEQARCLRGLIDFLEF